MKYVWIAWLHDMVLGVYATKEACEHRLALYRQDNPGNWISLSRYNDLFTDRWVRNGKFDRSISRLEGERWAVND